MFITVTVDGEERLINLSFVRDVIPCATKLGNETGCLLVYDADSYVMVDESYYEILLFAHEAGMYGIKEGWLEDEDTLEEEDGVS